VPSNSSPSSSILRMLTVAIAPLPLPHRPSVPTSLSHYPTVSFCCSFFHILPSNCPSGWSSLSHYPTVSFYCSPHFHCPLEHCIALLSYITLLEH
jgi:hypothetical protein